MNILIIIGLVIYVIYKLSTSFLKTSVEKQTVHPPVTYDEKEEEYYYEDYPPQKSSFEMPPPFLAVDMPASSGKTTKKKPDSAITLKAEKYKSPAVQLEQPTTENEFNIRSIEEVRRAVIWSEILNRKY